jgi:hypothetical protein
VPELLSRFHRRKQELENARKIGGILEETGELATEAGLPLRASADGHHADRRRGLPIVGRASTAGAGPGTDPARALLAKENRR